MFIPKNNMRKYFIFFITIVCFSVKAQTNCDDANSYLVNAYSHVKDAYDSNNISHLKYYANRSLESFKLSKKNLIDCDCQTVIVLSDKAIDLLAKVENAETFEDGRFFVKRAREISKESVIEIDKCSASTTTATYKNTDENDALTNLKNEQLKLKQQQEALKLKEAEIKKKLAEQNDKELRLKKEQLILSYKKTIALNIKTYNETLKSYDCNFEPIKSVDTLNNLTEESIDSIKKYYLNEIKALASNYLSQLNSCDN